MKTLRDTWLVFNRAMGITIRNPVWVIVGLVQPIYFLVLFGPLLKSLAGQPGFPTGNSFDIFVPGLLVMIGLFGAAFVGFGLIGELRAGVIERMRVTPVSRLALLLGRAGRDVVTLLVQAVILVGLSVPFGLHLDVGGVAIALLLLVLLGAAFACASYALAMILRTEDALAPLLNTLLQPAMLLSGVMLPLALAPGWLRRIADVNPLSYAVDATRASFLGHINGEVWTGFAVVAGLAILATGWAVRTFSRDVA